MIRLSCTACAYKNFGIITAWMNHFYIIEQNIQLSAENKKDSAFAESSVCRKTMFFDREMQDL